MPLNLSYLLSNDGTRIFGNAMFHSDVSYVYIKIVFVYLIRDANFILIGL